MAYERLLDRDIQPDQELVSKTIGREVRPVWEDVIHYLEKQYPDFESEWHYYNPQHGWCLRFRNESQQLCLLFPERGGFSTLITLNAKDEALAQDKIDFFNARIRGILSQPSTLPEGRWLWMRIEDHTDFVGFKLLLSLKEI